ncbi:hypothetical protein Avbf_10875 [Armadillidium vulgare]|nr:hypothetical protein Avbf_10875 [Armadillidium vulgare]
MFFISPLLECVMRRFLLKFCFQIPYFFLSYLDHPNSCVTLDKKRKTLIIPVGETKPAPLGSCYELECNKADGGNFNLVRNSCGKAVINGKVVEENKNVLYPECCQG